MIRIVIAAILCCNAAALDHEFHGLRSRAIVSPAEAKAHQKLVKELKEKIEKKKEAEEKKKAKDAQEAKDKRAKLQKKIDGMVAAEKKEDEIDAKRDELMKREIENLGQQRKEMEKTGKVNNSTLAEEKKILDAQSKLSPPSWPATKKAKAPQATPAEPKKDKAPKAAEPAAKVPEDPPKAIAHPSASFGLTMLICLATWH